MFIVGDGERTVATRDGRVVLGKQRGYLFHNHVVVLVAAYIFVAGGALLYSFYYTQCGFGTYVAGYEDFLEFVKKIIVYRAAPYKGSLNTAEYTFLGFLKTTVESLFLFAREYAFEKSHNQKCRFINHAKVLKYFHTRCHSDCHISCFCENSYLCSVKNKTDIKGHLALLGANAAWGLMSPVAKVVMAAAVVSPMLMAGMRMAGAALLFWLTSLFRPVEHVPAKDLLLLAGAGMLGVLLNQGCFIVGVGMTSPGEASVITTTMPMWVMLLAWLILHEPISFKKAAGIAIGAVGAITLVYSSSTATTAAGESPAAGDLLILAAQLCYALYLTLYRNFIQRYSLVTLMKWMFSFATLAAIPFALPQSVDTVWAQVDGAQWAGIAYVVVMGTYVAYICVMTGQKRLRPTVVGMYNYTQPVVAMAVGVVLGFDRFTVVKSAAICLIFAGVYLVTISKAGDAGR